MQYKLINNNYYNENDPFAAQWLRNLISANLIPLGFVDERSILDVKPNDLRSYAQCHFFAGIGGWSYALSLAAWPDHRPVWTGSCPCQPFSAAGKAGGFADERHLWPYWFHLIEQCKPQQIFGEQVASKAGLAWFDLVRTDLESAAYSVACADLCAACVGAPHIRQRLWFVAEGMDDTSSRKRLRRQHGAPRRDIAQYGCELRGVADAQRRTAERRRYDVATAPGRSESEAREWQWVRDDARASGTDSGTLEHAASEQVGLSRRARKSRSADCELADADGGDAGTEWLQRSGEQRQQPQDGRSLRMGESKIIQHNGTGNARYGRRQSANPSPWSDCDWLPCTDGKARPTQSGIFPLAHGIPGRVGRLRAYGNAIVPEVAAEFIKAYMECKPE